MNALPIIQLRHAQVESVLGFKIDYQCITGYLQMLGATVDCVDDGWNIVAPSWRSDLIASVDYIEEVLRYHGYDNIPAVTLPDNLAPTQMLSEVSVRTENWRNFLIAQGFFETINFSFISAEAYGDFHDISQAIQLANPLSQNLAYMRTSLLPGLLRTAQHNASRQKKHLAIFEYGQCFNNDKSARHCLSGLVFGAIDPCNWQGKQQ